MRPRYPVVGKKTPKKNSIIWSLLLFCFQMKNENLRTKKIAGGNLTWHVCKDGPGERRSDSLVGSNTFYFALVPRPFAIDWTKLFILLKNPSTYQPNYLLTHPPIYLFVALIWPSRLTGRTLSNNYLSIYSSVCLSLWQGSYTGWTIIITCQIYLFKTFSPNLFLVHPFLHNLFSRVHIKAKDPWHRNLTACMHHE